MSDRRSSLLDSHASESKSVWAAAPEPAASPEACERLNRLAGAIEAEIVPRLLLALSASCRAVASPRGEVIPDAADVAELARLLLAHDVPVALAFVEMLRQMGAPRERICLDLFAPAARHLGTLWERRQCDFEQFRLGMTRLQTVLRQLHAPGD
jgi:hypothetical protein